MCLEKLDDTTKQAKVGYKLFSTPNKRSKLFRTSWKSYPMYMNRWYTDVATTMISTGSHRYRTGFHVYRLKRDAVRVAKRFGEIVIKVEMQHIFTSGTQKMGNWDKPADVLVAQRIALREVVADYSKDWAE